MEVRQRKVLVLEDEPIVAMDIEATLTDAGFTVPAVIPRVADALKWLDADIPDVVVLDIHLQDGACIDVARRLVEKAVPFVVFTGSDPDEGNVDPVFKAGLWIEKPAPAEQIVAVIRHLAAAYLARRRIDPDNNDPWSRASCRLCAGLRDSCVSPRNFRNPVPIYR